MAWPDIFFKARKPQPETTLPPPFEPAPESPKPAPAAPQPPTIKPVPAAATPTLPPLKIASTDTSTRTLPAMHGVVLRPPARVTIGPPATPTAPAQPSARVIVGPTTPPGAPIKNIEQLMAEADPVRTLSQTGSVHLLKRLAPEPDATKAPAEPAPVKSDPTSTSAASLSPWPSYPPALAPLPVEAKKADPAPATPQTPATPPISTKTPKPEETTSPSLVEPAVSHVETPKISLQIPPPLMPLTVLRRKARLTELARIVLPPKREETQRLHAPPESSPTVVPPAFPVAAMTARAGKANGENPEPAPASAAPATESPFLERSPAEGSKTESAPTAPVPIAEEKPPAPLPNLPPMIDPEAHKPEPTAEPLPRVDPEAHRPPPAAPMPSTELSTPSATPEKREFHLANGERVAGVVLSETPEAVYIEHGTLGVLTIPRAQIAKRLVEIILINGDRIVGDIMAETADMLYVRHASLGMLSVPRAQRSTRVVEAILKDGDRILGEVLTETDTFTVIRSATLGTITVPHSKVAMLNRKIEQIELKSLPPPAPQLMEGQPPA